MKGLFVITTSLVLGIVVAMGFTTMVVPDAYADSEKCLSVEFADGGISSTCEDKDYFPKDIKQQCRDNGFKCSSSQTGFGEFGNFDKP